MNSITNGKISPFQLFFILFVSRLVVCMTFLQTSISGGVETHTLISLFLACLITLFFCVVSFCASKSKNKIKNCKILSYFYVLYFIFFASVTISRFSCFSSGMFSEKVALLLLSLLFALASCYSATLRIEALGRFSSFCAGILVLVVLVVFLLNVKEIKTVNFYPIVNASGGEIIKNSIIFASNSVEPALFLSLYDKQNKKTAKPLFLSVIFSYLAIMVLIFLCIGVMGSGANLRIYPIYTLFQLTSLKNFSRLDVIHSAFWVFALFLKSSVLIYCAGDAIKKFSLNKKCATFMPVVALLSSGLTLCYINKTFETSLVFYSALSVLFCVVFPIVIMLRKRGE